jgi:hypothetical protein
VAWQLTARHHGVQGYSRNEVLCLMSLPYVSAFISLDFVRRKLRPNLRRVRPVNGSSNSFTIGTFHSPRSGCICPLLT